MSKYIFSYVSDLDTSDHKFVLIFDKNIDISTKFLTHCVVYDI